MNPIEIVVIIVALGVLGSILSQYFKAQNDTKAQAEHEACCKALQSRLEEAEQRIKILERIVTSDEYELKRQFHELEKEKP